MIELGAPPLYDSEVSYDATQGQSGLADLADKLIVLPSLPTKPSKSFENLFAGYESKCKNKVIYVIANVALPRGVELYQPYKITDLER